MKVTRTIFITLCGAALTGCGLDQTAAQQRLKEADRQYQAATADCRKQFPIDEPKTIAAKMQCVNSSFALFIMPVMGANADLGQQWMAAQTNVAEQIRTGKMTVAQAHDTFAKMVAYCKRRATTKRIGANGRGSTVGSEGSRGGSRMGGLRSASL